MAEWSQLPTELLQLISNRLNSDFYLLRFRSVCSTWRSSTPFPNPNPLNLPSKFPLLSNDSKTLSLSKRTLFLISPPPQNQTLHHPWLLKINNSNNKLLSPLSHFLRLPCYFPPVLDFNELSVVEVGHEFVLGNAVEFCWLPPDDVLNNIFRDKVVVFEIEQCFVLLTINHSGKLAIFRCGDDQWTIVPDMRTLPYDGVCVFKGKPIAVDYNGKTVRVRVSVGVGIEPELGFDLVAEPIFGRGKKYLVESQGELLLLNKQLSRVYGVEWIVKFDVYRLDEKEKKWVELTSLKDRTLFLGDGCAFSLSPSDLGSSCFRNCVIFSDNADNKFEFSTGVFDLGLQKSTPLQKACPNFYDLFTPPKWAGLR